MLTKTSIIVFYLSVMSKDADVIFKWCNWLTLALVNVAGLALTLYNILQCMPVRAAWIYPTPTGATCTNIISLYLSSAPVNIITDIAILFLPMPILTGMRLPKKQKIILVATFSFGAFVAIVDVVRLAYLQKASRSRLDMYKNGTSTSTHQVQDAADFPWYAALSFMWSAIEVNLGIICACVPSLKPLFLRFMPQLIKNTGEDSTTASHSSIDAGPPKGLAEAIKGNVSMLNHPAAFRKPMVKEYTGEDEGDEMGFLNMLAGPADDMPQLSKTRTNLTLTRQSTAASDFDFVKMSSNKNMLKLTNKQSFWPIATVTVIFFLWGFAYGLLVSLVPYLYLVCQIMAAPILDPCLGFIRHLVFPIQVLSTDEKAEHPQCAISKGHQSQYSSRPRTPCRLLRRIFRGPVDVGQIRAEEVWIQSKHDGRPMCVWMRHSCLLAIGCLDVLYGFRHL